MNRHWHFLAALVAIGLPLLLVSSPWRQPEPIRIGVVHSLSGAMAVSEAPLVDAVRLAVEEINQDGGLLGRPVEIVVADGRSDNDIFVAQASRLITQEKVSALFACWTSACRKALKPVVEAQNHLLFHALPHEGLEQSPHIVYTGSLPNQQIIPGTRWALERFGKRVYFAGSDCIFPRTAARIVRDLVAVAGGSLVGERYLPLGTDDVATAIEDIRRLKPDFILNAVNGSNLAFFRALRAAGLEGIPVMSFNVAEQELAAMGPEAFHPAHYAAWSYFQSLDDPANRRFVSAFQERFGKDRVTSDPVEAAYNAVRLWAVAVREAGTDKPEDVNRVVGRVSTPGPSGIVAVDPATRHLWKWTRIGKARPDGQFDPVLASDSMVRPAPFPAYRNVDEWRSIQAGIEAMQERQP